MCGKGDLYWARAGLLKPLARLIDYRTSRLEPALTTIMGRVMRSKDAVVRALANLRTHGFLDWLRRWAATVAMAAPR